MKFFLQHSAHMFLGLALVAGGGASDALAEPVRLFSNNNVEAVSSGPTSPTTFRLDQNALITRVTTYHWNGGRGTAAPGTIALRSASGAILGPWATTGQPGQGGVVNAYWVAYPNITLEAGEYSILVSDPSTWSQNTASGNTGMGWVDGYPQ